MSMKKHLEHSVIKLTEPKKLNAVERSRKLKSLQVTENKLKSHISQCDKQIKVLTKESSEAQKQLQKIVTEKAKLEEENDGIPLVTEHAMLRYVERQMGIDLEKVFKEIQLLPAEQMVRHGNTIVTVLTDDEDHFNLAEREAQ